MDKLTEQGKIIVIDWHVFVHMAIFGTRRPGSMSSTYVGLNMIISCLRKIGIEPQDTVYLAVDFLRSWRKQYAEEYKANRKAMRESYTDIDWKKQYNAFNQLLKDLDKGTDWIVLQGEHLEADDIASYIVRNNKDKEIVLCTIDCLGGDSRIKMAEGNNKEISKVKRGDKVVSFDFKKKRYSASTVTCIHKIQHEEELLIHYETHSKPIRSSLNHYFYTNNGWKKAKHLKINDELMFYCNKPPIHIRLDDSYKVGYIMGLSEGDGWIDYKHRHIKIELKDKEPLIRIQQYIKSIFNKRIKIKKTNHKLNNKIRYYYCIDIYLNFGFDKLIEFYKKLNPSKGYKRGFLSGFYDAEGSLIERDDWLGMKIDNTNTEILKKIKNYCNDLNLNTTSLLKVYAGGVKIIDNKPYNCKPGYRINLNSENTVKFLNMTKPSLLRKYPMWKYHTAYMSNGLKVTKIEHKRHPRKSKFMHYDLTVEPHHNYIVNNSVVVHNSDWQQLWQFGDNIKIFSPKMKPRRYKIKPKKYNFALELAKKIKCEKADNLISKIVTEEDYETRKMLVDLTELPEFIDKQIEGIFSKIVEKENINISNVPYDSLREKIETLYNDTEHIVTYDWSVGFEERKSKRVAKKRKVKK